MVCRVAVGHIDCRHVSKCRAFVVCILGRVVCVNILVGDSVYQALAPAFASLFESCFEYGFGYTKPNLPTNQQHLPLCTEVQL